MTFRGDKPLVLQGEWHGHPRSPQPLPADGAALKAQRAKRTGERSERLWTHGDDRKPALTSKPLCTFCTAFAHAAAYGNLWKSATSAQIHLWEIRI